MKKIILFSTIILVINNLTFSQEIPDKRFIQLSLGVGVTYQNYAGITAPILVMPRIVLFSLNKDVSMSLNSPLSLFLIYEKTDNNENFQYFYNVPLTIEWNFLLGSNTFKSAKRKIGFSIGGGINYTRFDQDGPWNNFDFICPMYTIGFNWQVGRRTMGVRFSNNIYNKYKGFSTYLFGVHYQIFK